MEAGGRLGPEFIDKVVAECEMSEVARKAMVYMMATLIQELRSEEQFMADFANGVENLYEGRRVWTPDNGFLSVVLLGTFGILWRQEGGWVLRRRSSWTRWWRSAK